MPVFGDNPLTTDAGLFLLVLRNLMPGPRYEAYVRYEVEPCDTFVVGWNDDRTLVGCVEMGVTPLQEMATEEVERVLGFFRYRIGTARTVYGSN